MSDFYYFRQSLILSSPDVAQRASVLGGDAMLLSIDWRSPAAYRHAKHMPAAGFAWDIFAGMTNSRELEAFAQRWGLRFPKQP